MGTHTNTNLYNDTRARPMDAKTARARIRDLDRILGLVERLRDAEVGAAMKGDVDDLILPLVRIRKTMQQRLDVLQRQD